MLGLLERLHVYSTTWLCKQTNTIFPYKYTLQIDGGEHLSLKKTMGLQTKHTHTPIENNVWARQ